MNKFNFDYQQDFFTINSKLNDSHITFAHCINKDKIHWTYRSVAFIADERLMLRENTTTFDLMGSIKAYSWFSLLVYGVLRHFQQYFSNIVAVSFIVGRTKVPAHFMNT
jgi:hypothetical protein